VGSRVRRLQDDGDGSREQRRTARDEVGARALRRACAGAIAGRRAPVTLPHAHTAPRPSICALIGRITTGMVARQLGGARAHFFAGAIHSNICTHSCGENIDPWPENSIHSSPQTKARPVPTSMA
jgi:hypothetical protein